MRAQHVAGLVERESDVAALGAACERVRQGVGELVLVEGVAGVGKTRLLEEALRIASEEKMTAFRARGMQLEQEFPFGVARQLLEAHLLRAPAARRRVLLAGAASLAGRVLGAEQDSEHEQEPSFGALHGLYWLVANMAETDSIVLVVDDCHWADTASVRFLTYLARRLHDLPVLMVLASRKAEWGAGLHLLADLAAQPEGTLITPRQLSEEGTGRMLEFELGCAPNAELAAACHAATAGNPFYVHELALTIVTEGFDLSSPAEVLEMAAGSAARSIVLRLGRLGPHVIALARAVMVLGDGTELSAAAEVAEIDPGVASAAADVLMRHQIIAPDRTLSLIHPLVRSAIAADMSPSEQGDWHRRAARVLISRGARDDRIAAQLLASHSAGDPDAAARLRRAGLDAVAKGSPGTAVNFLRRALEEPPPARMLDEVLAELGTAELLADQAIAAVDHLRSARERCNDARLRADRSVTLWLALLQTGSVHEGITLLEETIDEVAGVDREAAMLLEAELFTGAMFDTGRLVEIWARLDRFSNLGGDTPAERRLLSAVATKWINTAARPATDVAELARRAVHGGLLIKENALECTKWLWGVGWLICTDQIEASEAALEIAHATATAAGSIEGFAFVYDLRSLLRLRQGRLADGETDAQLVLDLLRDVERTPMRDLMTVAMVRWLSWSYTERGNADQADALIAAHGLTGELDAGIQHAKLYRERALVRLRQGRYDEALSDALALRDFDARIGICDIVEAPWWPVAAEAYARLGKTEEAIAVAEEHLALARRWALPRDLGTALYTRGIVEPDAALRAVALDSAVQQLQLAPAPLELAKARAELGIALLRSGRRREAKDVLRHALDGASRCGASALAERVHEELKVAGARPRRLMFSGMDGLTASERRIAELAASGQTNREIAQGLFVTLKTVESHLSSTYRKLDIRSRDQLTSEFAEAQDGDATAVATEG